MRGPKFEAMSGLMSGLSMAAFLGAVLVAAPSVGAAKAQQSTGQTIPRTQPTGIPPIDGERPDNLNDPMAVQQRASRARAFAEDRQKHIVDETAKLLQLATELKVDMEKNNKSEPPVDVIRKAEDIEKLAHDVKQRMRS